MPFSSNLSHQWAVFADRTAADWMFIVCRTILSQSYKLLSVKSPGGLPFLRYWIQHAFHQWSYHASLVLPILTFNQKVNECLDACLPALHRKPQPRDSLCVGAIHFHERGGVPNKLAGECKSPICHLRHYLPLSTSTKRVHFTSINLSTWATEWDTCVCQVSLGDRDALRGLAGNK
jgi:hypothetical protein